MQPNMNEQNTTPPPPSEGLRKTEVYTKRLNASGNRFDDLDQRSEVNLTAAGAIEEKIWGVDREYPGCGHDARRPRGGRCGEPGCFRDSCAECYTRCSACQVGLCLMHVRYLQNEAGQKVPVCAHCRDTIQRRRFWRKFWAFVLSPFVTLEDQSK